MISKEELNPHGYTLTPEQAKNFEILFERINKVRAAYGVPMIVTSGVRSIEDQMEINPKSMGSNHLKAAACDISDKDGKLWQWIIKNMKLMEEIGFWFESKIATPTWVHFQVLPPKSGKRVFSP